MSGTITFHELPPSPNNMKVRIALNYKSIPFETRAIPLGADRDEIVAISGQPLTPMIQHGDTVVFDSSSILRYLDANFRDTPRLFSEDREVMAEIERWEAYGKTAVSAPIGIIFRQAFASTPDPSETERACALLDEATADIEQRLGSSPWLVGDSMTAADVVAAPFASLGMLTEETAAPAGPVGAFFLHHLKLGDGRERTRDWVRRVVAYWR